LNHPARFAVELAAQKEPQVREFLPRFFRKQVEIRLDFHCRRGKAVLNALMRRAKDAARALAAQGRKHHKRFVQAGRAAVHAKEDVGMDVNAGVGAHRFPSSGQS